MCISENYYFIKISDIDYPETLLFPSDTDGFSPFYSTDNAVSIKFVKPSSSNLNGLRIRAEKV